MAARLAIGNDPEARLRRLSAVFAVELRLKIVAELYMREMSPRQFFEEFGGSSIPRVTRNFERLVETGWLRLVRTEGPGGARRGATEHFYRATEAAFFDAESWALVPYSMRVASSWSLFKQVALRIRESLEEPAAGASRNRDLSCTRLMLDRLGWENLIEAVEAEFLTIFEEQKDARLRAIATGEELMRKDVLMIAFESPLGEDGLPDRQLVQSADEPLIPFPERLAPFLADDLSRRIVGELERRQMSIPEFHREVGGATVGGIRRRFKKLETSGWLKRVDRKTGGRLRGASEYFYRATQPAFDADDAWSRPPPSLEGSERWRTFEGFSDEVVAAMRAGAFDRRLDRYVTFSFLSLDLEGWEHVVAGIEALAGFMRDEQQRAADRMAESGEAPLAATVGLAALEAPANSAKAP